jgi:nitrogen fixation NifU-like protein
MSSDLRDLYQETILDHGKRPRNFRTLENANRRAEGYNPLCGDRETVYLDLEGDVVRDISFKGAGCAISTASASMMTESLKGKSRSEAEALFQKFHELITGKTRTSGGPSLGKLEVFEGVRDYPVRIKCATLPWHTMRSALSGEGQGVSTEAGAEASSKEEPHPSAAPPKAC